MMLDLTVIVLTYNEELHIRRCLENIKQYASKIYVIDSFSTDKTVDISKELGAVVLQNKWPGNQAEQFNWALDNINIETEWVLRLDADEYLLPELIEEFKERLPKIDKTISGISLKRRHIFLGKWVKRGTYPVIILRMFRNGKGRCEQRLMDEHLILSDGNTITFENDFVDHNLNPLVWWIEKHNNYAIREAVELLDLELNLSKKNSSKHTSKKEQNKKLYIKIPIFFRAFLYFCIRYFIKGGFLDGKEGFLWHFLQGLWYRTLVDAKIFEIKKRCNNNKSDIIDYIKNTYNISIDKL